MKSVKYIFCFLVLSLASISVYAAKCSGNACGEVSFYYENGCHYAQNHSGRKVNAQMGAIKFELRPGQTHTLTNPFGGGCLRAFAGGTKANYAD